MGFLDLFKADKKQKKPEAQGDPNSFTGDSGLVHSPIEGQTAPGQPPTTPVPPAAEGQPAPTPPMAPPVPGSAQQGEQPVPAAQEQPPQMPPVPQPVREEPAAPMPEQPSPQPEQMPPAPEQPAMQEPPSMDLPTEEMPDLPDTDHVPGGEELAGVVEDLHTPIEHVADFDDNQIKKLSEVDGLEAEQEMPEEDMDMPPPQPEEEEGAPKSMELPPLPEVPKWEDEPEKEQGPKKELPEPKEESPGPAEEKPPEPDELPPLPEEGEDVSEKGIPNKVPDLELFGGDEDRLLVGTPEEGDSFKKLQDDLKKLNQPLFVNMNEFGDVIESIKAVNSTLHESDKIFHRLRELKDIKDKKLGQWHKSLEEIQRKLVYLDNKVFEVL